MTKLAARMARLGYWLVCCSPLCFLWTAIVWPPSGPMPIGLKVIWWTLAIYAPAGFVLCCLAWVLLSVQPARRGGRSYAEAGTGVGAIACLAVYFGSDFLLGLRGTGHMGAICASRLKQVGLALQMYVQDYDEHFPVAYRWVDTTLPYSKDLGIYKCPADAEQAQPSYGFNRSLNLLPLERLVDPRLAIALIDAKPGRNPIVGKEDYPFTRRHEKGVYVLFAAGHVKFKQFKETLALDWLPSPPKPQPRRGKPPTKGITRGKPRFKRGTGPRRDDRMARPY